MNNEQTPAIHHGQATKCRSYGTARHVGPPPQQLELGGEPRPQRYTSHFARCEQASSWRRKK